MCNVNRQWLHAGNLFSLISVFSILFSGELSESRQDIVTLREVDSSAVELLIKFVYTGTVEVSEDIVQCLLPAANLPPAH